MAINVGPFQQIVKLNMGSEADFMVVSLAYDGNSIGHPPSFISFGDDNAHPHIMAADDLTPESAFGQVGLTSTPADKYFRNHYGYSSSGEVDVHFFRLSTGQVNLSFPINRSGGPNSGPMQLRGKTFTKAVIAQLATIDNPLKTIGDFAEYMQLASGQYFGFTIVIDEMTGYAQQWVVQYKVPGMPVNPSRPDDPWIEVVF